MSSPMQRTMAELRRRGWTAQITEHWNMHGRVRVDLFGCIDVLAMEPGRLVFEHKHNDYLCLYKEPYELVPEYRCTACGVAAVMKPGWLIAIQCCAGSSHAARRDKILAEPRMREWLATGNRLAIWSWSKTNERQRGKRKLWTLREEEITVGMFEAERTAA